MRKLLLVIAFLSITSLALKAQILPDWTWAKSIGGSQGVQVQDVLIDDAGNIYVSATAFAGPLRMDGAVFSTDTNQNAFVAKFSSSGNLLWQASVAKKNNSDYSQLMPVSMFLDNSSNIYFVVGTNGCNGGDTLWTVLNAGIRKEFPLVGMGCGQQPRMAVIKLDSEGNLIYESALEGYGMAGKKKGGTGGLVINNFMPDKQGNLYLAGSFMLDSLKLGSLHLTGSSFYQNSFISKLDSAGNFLWVTSDSTSSPAGYAGSEAASLALDASGNLLVFGDFNTINRIIGSHSVTAAFGTRNLYFLSLDNTDGSVKIFNAFGGDYQDIAQTIMPDGNSNFYITGFTSSSDIFGQSTPGTQNYTTFLANIDANGTLNWAKLIKSEIQGTPYSPLKLVLGPDNFPVLTGLYQAATVNLDGFNIFNHDATGYYKDFFTARFDPNKMVTTYFKSFGSPSFDELVNVYTNVHNMLTVIVPINDTVFYIGNDTLTYPLSTTGFLIAHIDTAGKLLGQASFIPYVGQSFSVTPSEIAQSYSGYLAVAGGFYGTNLYLGSNNLLSQDTVSFNNMFVSKMAYKITGTILDQFGSQISDGYVKLFVLAKSGPAVLVDSMYVNIEGNSYYFNDAPLNGGLLYAAADTTIYHNYAGTYSGNTILWSNAAIIDLVSTPPALFNIKLQKVLPVSGPGTIEGTVSETLFDTTISVKKFAGRPMKGASVVLVGKSTKGTDSIVAITYTDEMGFYRFVKVPAGNYYVWIDVAGLGMKEYYSVAVSELQPEVSNVDYIVAESGIYKDLSSGIKITKRLIDGLSVFPNPAFNYITVTLPVKGIRDLRMEIFNINGATVESILAENISMESININVAGLAPGIYLLKAECDGNAPLYSRFVKE